MPSAPKAPTTPKVRVLVADDEEVMARTLATVLELGGYDVCAVYGPVAALRILEILQPDLVVTDVGAPQLTGVEIASVSAIPAQLCRVLLLPGNPGVLDLLRASSLERLELLLPPIRAEDLLKRLRPLLCAGGPALLIPLDTDDHKVH